MIIDQQLLDRLSMQAKASPRLRQNLDLRDTPDDQSQRMLNAIEPGSLIPIHRHPATSEDAVVLRGRIEEIFYDAQGHETHRVELSAGGPVPAVHIPQGEYHTCRSLEPGTVIIEFKNTPYDPAEREILPEGEA